MHKQGIPDIDLFIEQDSDRTPESRKFYIIHQGKILASYATLKGAANKYNEIKKEIGYTPPQPPEANSPDLASALAEEWMSRTELYWYNSASHRSTNKVRR
ncbi:MAG TPA: hypothetical protein VH540_16675 [Ktedonobacterales bacterium]|jgi:hypothetical protein